MVRPIPLQQRMREMSSRMVEATNASQSDVSYDPDFVLHTNGGVQNIAAFRAGHQRVHATGSRCAVAYDKDAWVAHGNRLGAQL